MKGDNAIVRETAAQTSEGMKIRRPRRTLVTSIVGLLSLVAAACGGSASGDSRGGSGRIEPVGIRLVPAPKGRAFLDLAWLPHSRWLVVTAAPRSRDSPTNSHLVTLSLKTFAVEPVPFESESGCSSVDQLFPTGLSDGRLAYLQYCFGNESRLPDSVGSLRAYNVGRKTTSLLRPYRLPVFTGRFAFSPIADRGLLNDGNGLRERLMWLDRRSLRPLALPVSRVGDPAWSSDGSRVIVDGVPASAGPDSPLRTDTPWALYLLDRHGKLLRRLPWKLRDGAPASWSPDGRWLVALTRPDGEAFGLWLFRASGQGRPLLLKRGAFGRPKWISNREIAVPVGAHHAIGPGFRGPEGLYLLRLPRL